MPKFASTLALSVLLAGSVLPAGPAEAQWRAPISGAPIVLPSRFMPMRYPMEPPRIDADEPTPIAPSRDPFRLPLLERRLSLAEKTSPIDAGLREAIERIEPLFDPTLVEGPGVPRAMAVSAGTAMMDDVFADHWHAASADPNVDRKVSPIAMGWQRTPPLPCDAFTKTRPHRYGEPALTALSASDCARLSPMQRIGLDGPLPIAAARNSIPVFTAPLPGSRLSSQDFWAAQRARIAEIQAHLHRKWEPDPDLGLRR